MATQMPQKKQTLVLRRIDDPDAVAPTTKVTYNESLSGTPKNNFGNAQPATDFNAKARRRRTTGPSIADGPTAAAAANATSSSRFNEVFELSDPYVHHHRSDSIRPAGEYDGGPGGGAAGTGSLAAASEQNMMRVWSIGTALSNDLIFHTDAVDPRHAVVRVVSESEVVIQDLNSTFGTFVNDSRVRGGSVRKCVVGDVVRFGISPYGPCFRLDISGSESVPLNRFRQAKSLPEPVPAAGSSRRFSRRSLSGGGGGGGGGDDDGVTAIPGEFTITTPRGGPAVSQKPATLMRFSQNPENPDHHTDAGHLKGPVAKLTAKRRVSHQRIEASRFALEHTLPRVFAPFPDLSVGDEVEVLHYDPTSGNVGWAKGTIENCLGRDGGRDGIGEAAEGAAEEKGEDGVFDLPTPSEVRARRRSSLGAKHLHEQIEAARAEVERTYEVFCELDDGSYMHYPRMGRRFLRKTDGEGIAEQPPLARSRSAGQLRIFTGTMNLGNARLGAEGAEHWIPDSALEGPERCDLIVIGVQERGERPAHLMATLSDRIGDEYVSILEHELVRCGQIQLMIWARSALAQDPDFSWSIDENYKATGLLGVYTNKGGVVSALRFNNTRFAFVCSHLEAHENENHRRNRDRMIYRILDGATVGQHDLDVSSQFHHVFFLGDLNYRTDFGRAIADKQVANAAIGAMITGKQYSDLVRGDELHLELERGAILSGFKTGMCAFPPTYKVLKGQVECGYKQKRRPSYTDRVLYRSLPGCPLTLTEYTSVPEVTSSDHKPVRATFIANLAPEVDLAPSETTSLMVFGLKAYGLPEDGRYHVVFYALPQWVYPPRDGNGNPEPPAQTRERVTGTPAWDGMVTIPLQGVSSGKGVYLIMKVMNKRKPLGTAVVSISELEYQHSGNGRPDLRFSQELQWAGERRGVLTGKVQPSYLRDSLRALAPAGPSFPQPDALMKKSSEYGPLQPPTPLGRDTSNVDFGQEEIRDLRRVSEFGRQLFVEAVANESYQREQVPVSLPTTFELKSGTPGPLPPTDMADDLLDMPPEEDLHRNQTAEPIRNRRGSFDTDDHDGQKYYSTPKSVSSMRLTEGLERTESGWLERRRSL